MRILRRHHARGIALEDALHDGTVLGIARYDRHGAGLGALQRFLADIEAHARHARALVRTVAAEAGVRHDGANVAVETDFCVSGYGQASSQPCCAEVHHTCSCYSTHMPRYAAIDIGSNSVRMEAAEVTPGQPTRVLAA